MRVCLPLIEAFASELTEAPFANRKLGSSVRRM